MQRIKEKSLTQYVVPFLPLHLNTVSFSFSWQSCALHESESESESFSQPVGGGGVLETAIECHERTKN